MPKEGKGASGLSCGLAWPKGGGGGGHTTPSGSSFFDHLSLWPFQRQFPLWVILRFYSIGFFTQIRPIFPPNSGTSTRPRLLLLVVGVSVGGDAHISVILIQRKGEAIRISELWRLKGKGKHREVPLISCPREQVVRFFPSSSSFSLYSSPSLPLLLQSFIFCLSPMIHDLWWGHRYYCYYYQ